MRLAHLWKSFYNIFRPEARPSQSGFLRARGAVNHVIILDGTMSSLVPGRETNAGRSYRLLSQLGPSVSVYYESGVQWRDWRSARDVVLGRGINRQIRRAYGYLASRYRTGDKIYLLGYSRGAYAVRSLAGVIDQVGLLCAQSATERNVKMAYRHYQTPSSGRAVEKFRAAHCHSGTEIEMVGVWDTVKALGLRLPFVWRWSEAAHAFHNHHLGHSIRHGFHALALNETRRVFEPVLWTCPPDWTGRVEQVWFSGAHGDIGGQLGDFIAGRPLANIPLVWMLEHAEACGLPLPNGWCAQYPTDVTAPSVGTWGGWGKFFLIRRRRLVGADISERVHESVALRDPVSPQHHK